MKKNRQKKLIIMRSVVSILLIIFCEYLFCFMCVYIPLISCRNEKRVWLISRNCLSVIRIRENFLMSVSNKKLVFVFMNYYHNQKLDDRFDFILLSKATNAEK